MNSTSIARRGRRHGSGNQAAARQRITCSAQAPGPQRQIALAGPEKPDSASAISLLLYSRDGAGPPERVKAGQGLTGPARAPGAVPDGDPYR